MKALIDEQGFFKIARRQGSYTDQFCPFREVVFCGTWCPLFGEPQAFSPHEIQIAICQGRKLNFTEVRQEEAEAHDDY